MKFTAAYPDHAILDGHVMRLIIESEYVGLRLVCPREEEILTDETVPACRIVYDDAGYEVEDVRHPRCNLREHLENLSLGEAIALPAGVQVEIRSAPFPIAWWWDDAIECYVWAPANV